MPLMPLAAISARLLESGEPTYMPVVHSPGARVGRCWENVGTAVRRDGGQRIYGWTVWARPHLYLTAEFHAIWQNANGELVDPTPKIDGEGRVLFCAAAPEKYPGTSFNFLQRPPQSPVQALPRRARYQHRHRAHDPAQKAYEVRKAAKQGISLEKSVGAKVPLDELETHIDKLFALCDEIDFMIEVRFEGMTSKYPDKVWTLEAEKMRIHELVLELAHEKLGSRAESNPLTGPRV
jgi:hypothetical protein